MLDQIAQILQIPGEMIRQLILTIPLSGARALFVLYPVFIIIWVMTFKEDEVKGKLSLWGDRSIDIRPFAIIAMVGQIIIYCVFS